MADEDKKTSGQGGGQARGGGGRGRGGSERGNERGNERGGEGGRGRGRGRGKKRDKDKDAKSDWSETLIAVYRCSATVKGGRRLSFGAMMVVGNGKGQVGIGYGKAREVPGAFQKALKNAYKSVVTFPIAFGGTIPHQILGRYSASEVMFVPARPGTGLIAGAAVKAILEAGGLQNVLTKSTGNNNTRNIVKATINALQRLRSKDQVEALRGVTLETV
jgi:small subunit ribosomal protein S5